MIKQAIARIIGRISDTLIHGRNKAMITLGTDREVGIDSGYGDGGENDVDSAIIDIVVGYDPESEDPIYADDKSRIYIAEKTDPDSYFGVSLGDDVEGEPAIVQISDNIYLKSRGLIKILNGNVSILIKDGEIEIKSENKATISVGDASKIVVTTSGIELDTGQGINGKVITHLDTPVHIDPVTGGQVIANFTTLPLSNNKVVVK